MKTKKITEQCVKTKLSCKNNKEDKLLTEEDLKAAFNAGRDSVMESISDLEFKPNKSGGLVAENTPCIDSYRIYYKESTKMWSFGCGFNTPEEWFDTKDEAINAANKDYRRQLKETFEQILK